MTRTEQIELSDALNVTHLLMERVDHLLQIMQEDYFGKFDPNDTKDAVYIKCYFPRMRSVASLIREQLNGIAEELPKVGWVDALKCEDEES